MTSAAIKLVLNKGAKESVSDVGTSEGSRVPQKRIKCSDYLHL